MAGLKLPALGELHCNKDVLLQGVRTMLQYYQHWVYLMNTEQTTHQAAANPQTKSVDLACESTCRLPSSALTITRHLLLLHSPKANTHFTIPHRVEGWVDVGALFHNVDICLACLLILTAYLHVKLCWMHLVQLTIYLASCKHFVVNVYMPLLKLSPSIVHISPRENQCDGL